MAGRQAGSCDADNKTETDEISTCRRAQDGDGASTELQTIVPRAGVLSYWSSTRCR